MSICIVNLKSYNLQAFNGNKERFRTPPVRVAGVVYRLLSASGSLDVAPCIATVGMKP